MPPLPNRILASLLGLAVADAACAPFEGLPATAIGYDFGNALEAHRSVTTAIAAFALSPDSWTTTVASCLSLGGDVDTLACMAAAMSGARLGTAAIPPTSSPASKTAPAAATTSLPSRRGCPHGHRRNHPRPPGRAQGE